MPVGTKNSVIKGCGMHHVAVQVRDWEASMKLYQEVLGMEFVAQLKNPNRKVILLDMGDGSHIELLDISADTPAPGSPAANDPLPHIALATTDTQAAIEHVRAAGYEVTVETKVVDFGSFKPTIAFFRGPNGEIIEFFQTD